MDDKILYGSKSAPVRVHQLAYSLIQCSALHGKPKIVFINACRGTYSPTHVEVDDEQIDSDEEQIDGCSFVHKYRTPVQSQCSATGTGNATMRPGTGRLAPTFSDPGTGRLATA